MYAFNCTSPSVERISGRLRNWFDVFPVYLSAFLNTKLYTLSLYDVKLPHAWFKTYVNDSWLTIEFLDCIFFPLHTNALLLKKRLTLRFFLSLVICLMVGFSVSSGSYILILLQHSEAWILTVLTFGRARVFSGFL